MPAAQYPSLSLECRQAAVDSSIRNLENGSATSPLLQYLEVPGMHD